MIGSLRKAQAVQPPALRRWFFGGQMTRWSKRLPTLDWQIPARLRSSKKIESCPRASLRPRRSGSARLRWSPASNSSTIDAPTVIRADDLLRGGDTRADGQKSAQTPGSTLGDPAAVVFLGPNGSLDRAIDEGRVPDTPFALIFEDGQWRRTRPAMVRSCEVIKGPNRRPRLQNFIDRCRAEMLGRARSNISLRRLQPIFDRREMERSAHPARPGDYPFRLKRIVRGKSLARDRHAW